MRSAAAHKRHARTNEGLKQQKAAFTKKKRFVLLLKRPECLHLPLKFGNQRR